MIKRFLSISALAVLLTGCPGFTTLAHLATACDGMASVYFTAADFRAAGKLSATEIKVLTDLEPAARAACNKANPPNDISGAIATAKATTTAIAKIITGK